MVGLRITIRGYLVESRAMNRKSSRDVRAAASAVILLLAATTSEAQERAPNAVPEGPGHGQAQHFEPAGKYALEIDGEAAAKARIYLSLNAGSALLVTAPELPAPLLMRPQEQRLDQVQPGDLRPRTDGAINLAAGAELEPAGTYTIEGTSLLWSAGAQRMRLLERPLLGLHRAPAVAAWDPDYARRALRYSPSRGALETLRTAGGQTRVRVYFGSWCPRCAQAVPRLMRLAFELEGSGLRFEFFGMPRLETDAPESFWREAQEAGIFGDDVEIVPLAVVTRGSRRIGRITAGWGNPERELEKILTSTSIN